MDNIWNLLESDENPMEFLVHYGSRKQGSDVDLLVVYDQPPLQNKLYMGKLDILALGITEFMGMLKHHDVFVTEPILTGELKRGNQNSWDVTVEKYMEMRPQEDSIYYLIARAFNVASQAKVFLSNLTVSPGGHEAMYFWTNLSFAVAYFQFAMMYAEGKFPVTLKEATKECKLLADTVKSAKNSKGFREDDIETLKEQYESYIKWVTRRFYK